MSKQKAVTTGLLQCPAIPAVTYSKVDAINAVMKHFEGYIIALYARRLYDESQPYLCVDEGLRRRLDSKLIARILIFNTI
ncbi:helix-turn-helix domain-containing protein [Tissierella carlieri]|uniref:helix-turn-helix domain-containing protein n=1 Tax=Tissierella carlieri TaxID=689904 RepID=UPI001C10F659|nr:helix-turn-helix domain-containing protein [Tissierella carlieri]MBU5311985.1 helix-turn-helix domain-containing protein [Tissierella carlieri]